MFFFTKRIFREIKWLFLLLLLGFSLVACGPSLDSGAPIIRLFEFKGQDPNNPQIFNFVVQWQDFEGDLGVAHSVNISQGEKKSLLSFLITDPNNPTFTPLKVDSPIRTETAMFGSILVVAKGTMEGEFTKLGIELGADSGNYPKSIKVQLTIWDSQGHQSNQPWVLIKVK